MFLDSLLFAVKNSSARGVGYRIVNFMAFARGMKWRNPQLLFICSLTAKKRFYELKSKDEQALNKASLDPML
jgi:hypothetical protein